MKNCSNSHRKKYKYKSTTIHGKQYFVHRLVMAASLGRELLATEDVHHINDNTLDNRIENLKVMTHSGHTRLHHTKDVKCNRGHERKSSNLYIDSKGHRKCKECHTLYNHKEEVRQRRRQYYQSNREKMKIYYQQYYQTNKGRCNQQSIEYYWLNRDRILAHLRGA